MSVLVNGMEMPKNCLDCFACHVLSDKGLYCEPLDTDVEPGSFGRLVNCPLVPIPPHGRLIDAAEISEHKYTTIPSYRKKYADEKPKSDEEIIAFKLGWNYAIDAIVENAPTIITASDKDINVLYKEEGE